MKVRFELWDTRTKQWLDKHSEAEKVARSRAGADERFLLHLYSGLCDCDGNEIHDGHIITVLNTPDSQNPNKEVIFTAGMFGFTQMSQDGDRETFLPLAGFVPKYVKIIGDIYQSPELLSEEAGAEAHKKMLTKPKQQLDVKDYN